MDQASMFATEPARYQQTQWSHLLPQHNGGTYPVTNTSSSPTESSFPAYYPPPNHPRGGGQQLSGQQITGSTRPAASTLSLNLSSLSVDSSAASSSNASPLASRTASPISPTASTHLHGTNSHIGYPQQTHNGSVFQYGSQQNEHWSPYAESGAPGSSHSTSSSEKSLRTKSSMPTASSLHASTSIDEATMFENINAGHPRIAGYDENDTAFSIDPNESPAEGSSTSEPPDEIKSFDNFHHQDGMGSFPLLKSGKPSPPAGKPPQATNNFVTKLYQMISDPKSCHFISWTELGTSFVVSSVGEFSRSILGSHFKHNNFSSFVRQLNMYGFHKVNRTPRAQRTTSDAQTWEFSHSKFLRGRPDLLEEIKRKALEPDPSVRQRVELPAEVALQLMRMSNGYDQVTRALFAERAKVDRLTNVVKAMYDTMQQTMPGSLPSAFPMDLLEPMETPPILITSPSDTPFSSFGYNNSPTSNGATSVPSSYFSVGGNGPVSAISPNSSPTSSDFPFNSSLTGTPSYSRNQTPSGLPHMNLPSLPRYDEPNGANTPASPGGDTLDALGSDGRAFGAKRQRMNHGSDSTPSSAIHATGDQQQQIPQPGMRRLARARSDSAPLGMQLGQVWENGGGSSGRPRSGTQLGLRSSRRDDMYGSNGSSASTIRGVPMAQTPTPTNGVKEENDNGMSA